MANRILWVVALVLASLALVAGCMVIAVPDRPYVVIGSSSPNPKDRDRVAKMDKKQLEDEVLRLAADNDRLVQALGEAGREIDRLKDQVRNLEDEVKELKKHKS